MKTMEGHSGRNWNTGAKWGYAGKILEWAALFTPEWAHSLAYDQDRKTSLWMFEHYQSKKGKQGLGNRFHRSWRFQTCQIPWTSSTRWPGTRTAGTHRKSTAETFQEKSKQHRPGAGLNHTLTNWPETGTGNRNPTQGNGAVAMVISGRREWSFFFGTFFFDPHRQRKKYSADWQVSTIPTCRGFLLLLFLTQSKKSSPAEPFCKILISLYWFAIIKGCFFTFYFAISPRSARPALSKNAIALSRFF